LFPLCFVSGHDFQLSRTGQKDRLDDRFASGHDSTRCGELKNSLSDRFVSGHGFSRAGKSFYFVIPSGFSPRGICFSDFFRSLFSRAAGG
jgi:hypothetical protein